MPMQWWNNSWTEVHSGPSSNSRHFFTSPKVIDSLLPLEWFLLANDRNWSSNDSSAFRRLYARITIAFLSRKVDDELTPEPIYHKQWDCCNEIAQDWPELPLSCDAQQRHYCAVLADFIANAKLLSFITWYTSCHCKDIRIIPVSILLYDHWF